MYTCMVEYKIAEEHRAAYLGWIETRRREDRFLLYEGTDQRGLFVELWHADSREAADAVKEERCRASSWQAAAAWVPGGAERIHAWVFRRL